MLPVKLVLGQATNIITQRHFSGQTEACTATETATLNHHLYNPAVSQGLAGSLGLLTDSVTNA